MKKLLFITWSISYGYGTEKSLADVLNRISDTEYEISILPLFKRADSDIFAKHIKILPSLIDYTEEDFDEQAALKHYYDLLANPMLFNQMIREKYDCIIACNHNAPSYFASYLAGGTKILWIRGDLRELDYSRLDKNTEQYRQVKQEHEMQANVFKCFQAIVVISDVVRNTLEELFGITRNVYKISNSVDSDKIKRLSEEDVVLPDAVLFTTLGRLDYNKNQILLLKAAKKVRKQRSDFVIYLLGDGEERQTLEKYIKENHLEKNVKILGFVENPYPYIKNSAATVLTSLSEGFSLALVESAMLNTPFISTRVGVAEELAKKYSCGDIVNYDEKELSSIILRYLTQYDGIKKTFNVCDEYDVKSEVSKTVELIRQVLREAGESTRTKRLPVPEITIHDYELAQHKIQDFMYVLRVIKDDVPYEYLINFKSNSNKLIVFNNGAVSGGNVTVPVFQRHSWAGQLKTSSVFCMDPTLYVNRFLQLGWGIGKNDNYYLENSTVILEKIIDKMGVRLENTVIYGTSAGGYLSIIMGTILKGATVVADNTQLDVRNWIFKDALDSVVTFCFDHVASALNYKERFSVIDAFEKYNYIPRIYLHVNLCSNADNSLQLVPFLNRAEKMKRIDEYHGIEVILHFEPEKGHDGLGMEEAISFLYHILGID